MTGSQATGKSGVTIVDKKALSLKVHNTLRALHVNTPALQQDDELQKEAEAWAKHLAENDTFAHDKNRNGARENIFMAMGSNVASISKAVMSWYSESAKYDYNSENICSGTGHFTQVVWKDSVKLGVGVAVADKGSMKKTFVVARYKPPGNFGRQSEYKKNVLLKKDKAEVPTLEELQKAIGE